MPLPNFLQRLIPEGGFSRALAIVAGGTLTAQIINVVAIPILTRLYSSEEYGVLAVYTSLTTFAAVVSSLSYKHAINLPDDQATGAHVTVVALLAVLLTTAASALVIALVGTQLLAWTHAGSLGALLWLVPVGILGFGCYEVLAQWAARSKMFGVIARTGLRRSAVQVGTQVAGGAAGVGVAGLVFGQFLGQWSGGLQLAAAFRKRHATDLASLTWRRLLELVVRYRRFPLLATPAQAVNAVDSTITPLLLAYYFGASVAGLFALSHRALALPFFVVAYSAHTVFLPLAAEAARRGELAETTARAHRTLLTIGLPMFAVMLPSAPPLFAVVFGDEWRLAGVFVSWLVVRTCFTVTVHPIASLVFVLERQHVTIIFSSLQLVIRVGAIVWGARQQSPTMAIALIGLGTGALWFGQLLYLWRLSGNPVKTCLQSLAREVVRSAPFAAPLVALRWYGASDLVVTGAAVACGVPALVFSYRRLAAVRGDGQRHVAGELRPPTNHDEVR